MLAVLLVAAIATLASVRLSTSAAQVPAHGSAPPVAHRTAAPAAHRTAPLAAHRASPRAANLHRRDATRPGTQHRRHAKRPARLRVPKPGRLIRTLSGTGSRAIGSFRERRAVVLQWHTSKGPFQIYTSRGMILVAGHGHRGSIGLTRGNYSNLRVSAAGAWTIRISRRR
jgi:hypothetical protein